MATENVILASSDSLADGLQRQFDAIDRARRQNELTEAGRDYCNAFVKEHHDRLIATGIRVDTGFHNMLLNAFLAGARLKAKEADQLREELDQARAEYDGAYRIWAAHVNQIAETVRSGVR